MQGIPVNSFCMDTVYTQLYNSVCDICNLILQVAFQEFCEALGLLVCFSQTVNVCISGGHFSVNLFAVYIVMRIGGNK